MIMVDVAAVLATSYYVAQATGATNATMFVILVIAIVIIGMVVVVVVVVVVFTMMVMVMLLLIMTEDDGDDKMAMIVAMDRYVACCGEDCADSCDDEEDLFIFCPFSAARGNSDWRIVARYPSLLLSLSPGC